MMNKPGARIGYSVTLAVGLTLAALWVAGGRLPLASAAGPWFVATTGNDGNGCLSSGNACLTIGGAVGKASSGDAINIAAGTYPENVVITGKVLTFIGAGAGSTFVDGGSAGRVFDSDSDITVAELTIQNGDSAGSDGGGLYTTASVTLSNVHVINNTAFYNGGGVYAGGTAVFSGSLFQNNAGSQGGGAYVGGTLTLVDTQFITNTATSWGGGARALLAANVTGGEFRENYAGSSGGGLYAQAALTLNGTQFVSNTAGTAFGGGAYVAGAAVLSGASFAGNIGDSGGGAEFDGAATVTGTTFFSNTAITKGGGAYFNAVATLTNTVFSQNLGSGIGANGGGAGFGYTATLSGGAFDSNITQFAGGGAYFVGLANIVGTAFTGNTTTNNRGGGAYFNGPALVTGAAFTANRTPADRGGGAYFRDIAAVTGTDFVGNLSLTRGAGATFFASAALTGTRFLSNTAGMSGGGAYFADSFQMLDTSFISNTAQTGNGGAVFHAGPGSGRVANGLFTRNRSGSAGSDLFLGALGTTTLLHTTLANSSLNPGVAIFVNAGSVGVTNTIFVNAGAGLVITGGITASSDYNLFFNAPTNVITGSHSLTDTDPLFVNPAADNYRLGAGSPAAGAGLDVGVATDLDGAPRGSPPSIGAYALPTYQLTVSFAGTGLGSVTRAPNQAIYAQGTVVTLTATANGGSNFAGWSGDVSGLSNPTSVTMTSDKSVTATFNLNPPPEYRFYLMLIVR